MLVRVNAPADAADLVEFLRARIGAIVEERDGGSELEVSLLGSYSPEALRDELVVAVRQWSLVRQQPASLVELE
jgi:hypothetical protein